MTHINEGRENMLNKGGHILATCANIKGQERGRERSKTLKRLLEMAEEVEEEFNSDVEHPDFFVSVNVLFATYVQEERNAKAINSQLKATCKAYLLLMDKVDALSERVGELAKEIRNGQR